MITRPNMIIVGAGKAGSTSLHNYISAHPEAFGSKPKELMYFSSAFQKGRDWYLSHFPETPGARVYFESTPQYSFRDEFPEVPRRIHDFNPEMRIIYIVREPVSRIVSHFNHWRRVYPNRYKDIEASLASPQHRKLFVDRTRYYYQLEAYLELFPAERIHVVFVEDFKHRFEEALDEVFRFLDLEPVAATIPKKVHNEGSRLAVEGQLTAKDISAERLAELYQTLSPDVGRLLSHAGKPADFWGGAYLG